MCDYLVRAVDLRYTYPGGRRAAWDMTFRWPRVGVVALMGPNGSGKSTLLSMVVGLRRPSGGSLENAAESIGFLPQAATWPKRFTVEELLTYAAWWHRVPKAQRSPRVREAARALDVEDVLHERVGALSGGYFRRVMVAQSMVHEPELLVLDEPSVGLDPRQRVRLREQIGEISRNRLVVLATHLVEDVEEIATHVTILSAGEVVVDTAMEDVLPSDAAGRRGGLERLYLATVGE